jgi:Domain of unknown function (DUF4430)
VKNTLRVALAAACAAGLATAPAAVGLDTVIRVEGSSANLIPESAIPIEGAGTAQVFDDAFAPVEVSRASAFWQLYRATAGTGLGLGFTYFPSFDSVLVQRIGSDANAGSAGWQYRVDHVAPPVGASDKALAQGDRVLWYFGGADGARELDVAPSADRVATGQPFTVAVTSYAQDGSAAPGSGATVRYGPAVATADAAGTATFVAQAPGSQAVTAVRAGDIRSPARAVCSFAGDPTVCNLPPAAAPAGGQAAAGSDAVAPGSRISFPRLGGVVASARAIRGTAGPDRSDVARVEVALARRVGTLCRFRSRSGGLSAPRSCARRAYLPARTAGGSWALGLGKGLAPGLWRVWSRATDGAGNVEGIGLARVNTGQFRVAPAPRR